MHAYTQNGEEDTDVKAYFAAIPDKNYFLAAENGYPVLDFDALCGIFADGLDFAQCVDLTPALTLDSYYRTDIHWRQEALVPAAQRLAEAMDAEISRPYTLLPSAVKTRPTRVSLPRTWM